MAQNLAVQLDAIRQRSTQNDGGPVSKLVLQTFAVAAKQSLDGGIDVGCGGSRGDRESKAPLERDSRGAATLYNLPSNQASCSNTLRLDYYRVEEILPIGKRAWVLGLLNADWQGTSAIDGAMGQRRTRCSRPCRASPACADIAAQSTRRVGAPLRT